MTSVLILVVVIGVLFAFDFFGFLKRCPISWTLVWRIYVRILLVLGGLGVLAKTWSILVEVAHLNPRWLVSPSHNPSIDIVSTAVYAVALWGIWRWRKWGAYLVLVRAAFTVILQVFIYHSLDWHLAAGYTGLENLYADLSGAATWLVAFFFTWRYFT